MGLMPGLIGEERIMLRFPIQNSWSIHGSHPYLSALWRYPHDL